MNATYLHHIGSVAASIPRKLFGHEGAVQMIRFLDPGVNTAHVASLMRVAIVAATSNDVSECSNLFRAVRGKIVQVSCPADITALRLSISSTLKREKDSPILVVVNSPTISIRDDSGGYANAVSILSELLAVRRLCFRKRQRSIVCPASPALLSLLFTVDDSIILRQLHHALRASPVAASCDLRCFDLQLGKTHDEGLDDAFFAAFLYEVLRAYPIMMSQNTLDYLRAAWHGNHRLVDVCHAFHLVLICNDEGCLYSSANETLLSALYGRVADTAWTSYRDDAIHFAALYIACSQNAVQKLSAVYVSGTSFGDLLSTLWDKLSFATHPHNALEPHLDALRSPALVSPLCCVKRLVSPDETSAVLEYVGPPTASRGARTQVSLSGMPEDEYDEKSSHQQLENSENSNQPLDFFGPAVSDASRVVYLLIQGGARSAPLAIDIITRQSGLSGWRLAMALVELKRAHRISINATRRTLRLQ